MSNRRFVSLSAFVLLGSLFSACCGREREPSPPPSPRLPNISLFLNAAKSEIARKDYAKAIDLCLRAEAIDDSSAEAKYCVLLANVGELVRSVSAIIGLVSSQLTPAEYR